MQIDTNDMVSATDVNRHASRIIAEAKDGRMFVVMTNNTPSAIILGADQMQRVQDLEARIAEVEEQERDMRLLALSLVRMATDTGERHSLDDVLTELNIELDDDGD